MEGLTWKDLGHPEYVMTFLEGFILLLLSGLGFDVAANSAANAAMSWPTAPTIFAASLGGLLNGIRALRTLRAPAPANGRDRRAPPPPASAPPTPASGG